MAEIFKKGQMVPKRLKMAVTHRRGQYAIKFGCDVTVDGRNITPVTSYDGPIFMLPAGICRRRKNGTKQKLSVVVKNVWLHSVGTVARFS